jgi:Protein of unknown function (DUF3619)
MNEFDKDSWANRAKTLLDESAEGLDAATLSRLNRARQAAVAQVRPRAAQRWFLPAGLASACVLLLAVAAWHPQVPSTAARLPELPFAASASATGGGDIDLVSSDDSLELYQDLEFYAWLDAQDQGSDG